MNRTMNEEEGCVYFINMEGTNYLKIGYTYNFDKRLRQLQNNVPVGLVVLGQDWTGRPKELERDYHRVFKSYRLKSGEWFDIPNMQQEISKYRNMFAESYGVKEEMREYFEYDE